MKSLYVLILIVLFLLIAIVFILNQLSDFNITKTQTLFYSTQSENLRYDCNSETIYSFDDNHCNTICKGVGAFRSHHGVCTNTVNFNQGSIINDCDPKQGLLAILVGDPQLGTVKFRCLSVDLGIRPHNIEDPNILCGNGEIDIDYVKEFPSLKSCRCKYDSTLVLIPSTSTIRTRGVCVPYAVEPLFKELNLLYKN